MVERDLGGFSALLAGVMALYGRAPSQEQVALWFRLLAAVPLDAVRGALEAHTRDTERGRFPPLPADVLAQLAAHDGRPTADEAWAHAQGAQDERATVVWTEETARAWQVALPVLLAGDEVGARMAFKGAYQREVNAARAAGTPVQWSESLGWSHDQRAAPIVAAGDAGRLPAPVVAGLLEGPAAPRSTPPPAVAMRLRELRARLAVGRP